MLATLLLLGLAAGPGDEPRAVLLEARLAVEGDSVPAVAARWTTRLARDPGDRAALLGLATITRMTYEEKQAERLYRRLLAHATAPADEYGVYARLGLSRLFYERVDMDAVDSLVSEALVGARALHDRVAEADALQALGNARVDADKSAGLAYQDSALKVIPPDETDLIASVRCRRGYFLFVMGNPHARDSLAAALAFSRRSRARRAEAQCLRASARDLWTRGLEDSSIAQLRQATAILREVRDRRGLAYALTTLADVLRDRGAYGEARAALDESLEQAHVSRYRDGEALALHMLGTLSYSLRDIPTAAQYFDRALAIYDTLDDPGDRMNVRSWQANIARDRGDLAASRRLTLEAIEYDKRVGAVPGAVELYQALADIEILAGDWRAAAAALDSSEHLLRTHGIETWERKLAYQRGRLALHRGELDSAETIFRTYLRELDPADRLAQHEARAYLADILARRGNLAGAERELTVAGDELDAWRATLDDRHLRLMAFQATATDESDRNSSIPRVLAALAAGGRADAAFALAERRRARELGERLVAASALVAWRPDSAAPLVPSAVTASSDAGTIAALLPDDRTALIEYVTGPFGAPTTALVVTRRDGAARATVLPPADSLTGGIGRFIALVARGAGTEAEATALGRVLLQPVLGSLGPEVHRLIIVPDGPLHRVPWDALRLEDGRYVVERYTVAIAPSAGILGTLWRRPRAPAPGGGVRLLAFGDPEFGRPHAGDTLLPRLPASGAEARLVARYAPAAEVRLGARASAEYLRRTPLAGYGVIHFATHALVDDRAIGRTALALAPGPGGSGLVSPGELARLRLHADLVVLSACRTSGGVVVDGEGIQGLTAALLEAGARSVVATSWRIGDRSTVRFVGRLYGALARGEPVAEALRTAKLASLRAGDRPAVWAAFGVVGDPTVVVPLRMPAARWPWWAGGGAVLVVLVAAARKRRER